MNNYPRSAAYDPAWIAENWMGPNPLMLAEELCEHLELRPGMRVLDLGCGRALTSIFLAKEYGVTVYATDLWIAATENWERIQAAGVADLVIPIHAEAHALPYAEGFFDAALSIDSYNYFGTDEMYFPQTFSKLVKPGGQFGVVCPGLTKEFEKGYPEPLKDIWEAEYFSLHSAAWWQHLWEKTELAVITSCYDIPDTKGLWQPWAEWAKEHLGFNDCELLAADTGNDLALIAMTAVKKA